MRPPRRLPFALSVWLLFAASAVADEAKPGTGRFLLGASPSGFVRLDTVTGATSHCRQQPDGVWRCEPLLVEDSGVNAKLEALASEVARLSVAVAALNARVATLARVGLQDAAAPVAAEPPVNQGQGFAGRLVERFLDLVRTLKHGRAGSA